MAELAALTKGSGIILFGLPIALALCLRDWRTLRNRTFWLIHILSFGILLPRYLYTWNMVRKGMERVPVTTAFVFGQVVQFLRILPLNFGRPLVAAIAAGSLLSVWRQRNADALPLACALMMVGAFLIHCTTPNSVEMRRLFMAVPAMLILASVSLARLGRCLPSPVLATALPALVRILSLLPIFSIVQKASTGYRPVASWLLRETAGREQAILIASQAHGEGMLIAEIAQAAPQPALYLVRASKLLADSDWSGVDYKLLMNPQQVEAALHSIPVRFIVVDRFQSESGDPHWNLVWNIVEHNPQQWVLRYRQTAFSPDLRARGKSASTSSLGWKTPGSRRCGSTCAA